MVKTSKNTKDSEAFRAKLTSQFSGLDRNDPSLWPAIPRYALYAALALLVVVVVWFAWLSSSAEALSVDKAKEVQLRSEYSSKVGQAANLEALNKQREQVLQYVNQLEKQLPSKAEMDALLSDINQAGLGRGLQFELFRPGQVSVKEYYAELPIAIKVTGRYHEIGAFAADIASLSRIVTLSNLSLTPVKDGALVLDTTAKTYRYLDEQEVASQRGAANGVKK